MYFLYSLLLTLGLIVASPLLIIDALRKGKYLTGLSQRLGKIPSINSNAQPIIWLHCVSVGEAAAARTLVKELAKRFPSHRLVVSTTTITGQRIAHDLFGDRAAAIFYFPIDWAWTVRRVLRRVRPAAVLIMETELWPRLFRECRVRQIPLLLVNGRISDRSFRRYKLAARFISRALNDLSLALAQSERDAQRLRALGMRADRIRMPGNLKFDSAEVSVNNNASDLLRERFAFDGSQPLIVAASTHDPEDRVVIEALKLVREQRPARLLIAPRHPERFDDVASLVGEAGLTFSRRSQSALLSDARVDVVLLDTIGELPAAYALADIAFVGGSIAPRGGHNMLEPAVLGICVVTGPHTENFVEVTKTLLEDDAIIQLPHLAVTEVTSQLAAVLIELLRDESKRKEIGKRAQAVCRRNTGATERTIKAIMTVLNDPAPRPAASISSVPATACK
jgi:3-deoxy-D-manno-octulosonic-acid transferase